MHRVALEAGDGIALVSRLPQWTGLPRLPLYPIHTPPLPVRFVLPNLAVCLKSK